MAIKLEDKKAIVAEVKLAFTYVLYVTPCSSALLLTLNTVFSTTCSLARP